MRTLIKVGFGLLALGFVLIGVSYNLLRAEGNSVPINREGREITSETRQLGSGIASIELSGPIDMTLRQGAVASLVVRGEQRLLRNVETTLQGSTLNIGTRGMLLHHRHPLQVVLVLPSIEAIEVHGSGDSTVNGFMGERIDLQLRGSGSVKFNGRFKHVTAALTGSGDMEMNGGSSDLVVASMVGSGDLTVVGATRELKAKLVGSGDLGARHLNAEVAALRLNGSGDASLQASKLVNVKLAGSGDVRVYGNPEQRNVDRRGSGSVTFSN